MLIFASVKRTGSSEATDKNCTICSRHIFVRLLVIWVNPGSIVAFLPPVYFTAISPLQSGIFMGFAINPTALQLPHLQGCGNFSKVAWYATRCLCRAALLGQMNRCRLWLRAFIRVIPVLADRRNLQGRYRQRESHTLLRPKRQGRSVCSDVNRTAGIYSAPAIRLFCRRWGNLQWLP